MWSVCGAATVTAVRRPEGEGGHGNRGAQGPPDLGSGRAHQPSRRERHCVAAEVPEGKVRGRRGSLRDSRSRIRGRGLHGHHSLRQPEAPVLQQHDAGGLGADPAGHGDQGQAAGRDPREEKGCPRRPDQGLSGRGGQGLRECRAEGGLFGEEAGKDGSGEDPRWEKVQRTETRRSTRRGQQQRRRLEKRKDDRRGPGQPRQDGCRLWIPGPGQCGRRRDADRAEEPEGSVPRCL
mmetsp:Transcript_4483/g.16090  ORF Transcript_4483/g.16090 Transcript_4483/m.16090 type:complete len:235 (+) Transcript_4483:887-1591(+)